MKQQSNLVKVCGQVIQVAPNIGRSPRGLRKGKKIKVFGLCSKWVHVKDLVVVIAVVRTVRQTELICER